MLITQTAEVFDGRGFGGRGFGLGDGFRLFLPGFIGMLLLAVLVGLGVWLLTRNRVSSSVDPLRHAAARYASGKISRLEFERIQQDLAAGSVRPVDPPASTPAGTTPPL